MTQLIALPVSIARLPEQGPKSVTIPLDFSASGVFEMDLWELQSSGAIDFVQSVWIDNKENSASLDIEIVGGTEQVIRAQPYSQGFYPVIAQQGKFTFKATTSQGIVIKAIFLNVPVPDFTNGPVPGANITPSLTNARVNLAPATIGNNIIIAGVPAQVIRVYRTMLSIDVASTHLLIKSGATVLSGPLAFFPGGFLTAQASGIPWWSCGVGEDFIINSDAAATIGGDIGYTQG